jgi:zinc transport system substrate-binding protein
MNKKDLFITIIIVLVIISGAVIHRLVTKQSPPVQNNSLPVVATFYPLAYLAEQIGGQFVSVTNITPVGIEPHDFEPSPRDIAKIYQSKLFISNGGNVDGWADKIQPDLAAQGIPAITMLFELRDVLPDPAKADPHLWLDPILISAEADLITTALTRIDPSHTQEYNTNRNNLTEKLAQLDAEYKSGLANCQLREIITSHDAFNYLANRYNFTATHILGLSPEEEPSPKDIASIAKLAKSKHIPYIFFETMVSPKLSETIAGEIGAKTLVLNPIEGLLAQDSKTNQDYISLMKQNLANLKIAMICQ